MRWIIGRHSLSIRFIRYVSGTYMYMLAVRFIRFASRMFALIIRYVRYLSGTLRYVCVTCTVYIR